MDHPRIRSRTNSTSSTKRKTECAFDVQVVALLADDVGSWLVGQDLAQPSPGLLGLPSSEGRDGVHTVAGLAAHAIRSRGASRQLAVADARSFGAAP